MNLDLIWNLKMAWRRSAFGHPMGQAIMIFIIGVVLLAVGSVAGLIYLLS